MPKNWLSMRRWFDFRGRASRREYWLYQLLCWLVVIVPMVLVGALVEPVEPGATREPSTAMIALFSLFSLTWVLAVIASIAAMTRRLHDQEKSGWYMLLGLVPLVGWIFTLVFIFTPGDEGENMYGHDPRRPEPENYAGIF